MFDAYEAINDIIDDINEDYYESCYDAIYEELCNRVDYGELTIEEAEMINEVAAYKYLYEAEDVDKAIETDDDDDKKKKKSDKNIKKKINKKKVAAGVGLAAGAGVLAYGGKKYIDSAKNSFDKHKKYDLDRVISKPWNIDRIDGNGYSRFTSDFYKKTVQDQRKNYRSANKLGKKVIMNYLKNTLQILSFIPTLQIIY